MIGDSYTRKQVPTMTTSWSMLAAGRGGGDRGASTTTLEQPSGRSTVGSSRGQTDRGAVGAMALGGGGWSVVEPPTHDRRRAAAADEATDGAAMDLVLRSRRRIARNIRP